MRRLIPVLGLLLLGGCITEEMIDAHYAAATEPTPAIRASAVTAIKILLLEPYSVENAEISAVKTGDPRKGHRYLCARFDSDNRVSGLIGRDTTSVRMTHSEVYGVHEGFKGCDDARLRWFPFNELEKINQNS